MLSPSLSLFVCSAQSVRVSVALCVPRSFFSPCSVCTPLSVHSVVAHVPPVAPWLNLSVCLGHPHQLTLPLFAPRPFLIDKARDQYVAETRQLTTMREDAIAAEKRARATAQHAREARNLAVKQEDKPYLYTNTAAAPAGASGSRSGSATRPTRSGSGSRGEPLRELGQIGPRYES